jgi:tetratricopeptide (TPR) repeat protein
MQYELAEQRISRVRTKPQQPAFISIMVIPGQMQRMEEAVTAYDGAIRVNPNIPDAHYHRGNALKNLHRLEEARIAFEKAIRLRPGYVEAHYNLGNCSGQGSWMRTPTRRR